MAGLEVSGQQGPDRAVPDESAESLGTLTIADEEEPSGSENLKDQISSTRDEKITSPRVPSNATATDPPEETTIQLGSFDAGPDGNSYQPNTYQQAHTIYYGGYENSRAMWDEYPQFLNSEGMELGSHGALPLIFHTGYGYSPQMPFGPYSPVTTPLPLVRRESQMYSTQQSHFTGPYYQQPGPNTVAYLNSPSSSSQANLTTSIGVQQKGTILTDPNSIGMLFGPGPSFAASNGSSGGGNISGSSGNPYFHDTWQVFDGFGPGGLWSDWLKSPDGLRPMTPLSPAASPQPIGVGTFGHGLSPFSSGMGSPRQRPYDREYQRGGIRRQGTDFAVNVGLNGYGLVAVDKGRPRGTGSADLCSCNGPLDFLNEQNRGPRAIKPRNLAGDPNSAVDVKSTGVRVDYESYNNPDFKTEYDDARFFIIKSYSEDNVHKSIKYGVWASTPNGNKKLDGAYSEAKGKGAECPVFLLFSVNASAHFCGVAEMVGAVNFEKSVDYWQQDKWSGHFPVKWHVVKDVPNSLFRHIILENNDNKPVTNSRDTQEVKLEQGLEMLNIFKNHEARMSILDDFDFYEERQKAMQERKAHQRQQQQQQQVDSSPAQFPAMSVGSGRYNPGTAAGSGDYVSQSFAKTFAQAVRLDEKKKDESAATTVAGEGVAAAAVAAECFPNMGLAAPVKGGG